MLSKKQLFQEQIIDHQGEILTDFDGKLFLTLFDKVQTRKTLANDEASSERVFYYPEQTIV